MADTDKKFLEGLTAIELFQHAYPPTLISLITDFQKQIDDCQNYKESSFKHGIKLAEKEIFDLDSEIAKKTKYVKSLLEYYSSYNWPREEMQKLCRYYGIKTFEDNLRS